jgi:hypothetical protein
MNRQMGGSSWVALALSVVLSGLFLVTFETGVRADDRAATAASKPIIHRDADRLVDSNAEIVGTPTIGEMGIAETVEQIMA